MVKLISSTSILHVLSCLMPPCTLQSQPLSCHDRCDPPNPPTASICTHCCCDTGVTRPAYYQRLLDKECTNTCQLAGATFEKTCAALAKAAVRVNESSS